MSLETIFIILCVLAIAFQLYTTIRLICYGGYSAGQKTAQLFFIWLIPLVGAWIVNLVIGTTVNSKDSIDRNFTPDNGGSPPGIGDIY